MQPESLIGELEALCAVAKEADFDTTPTRMFVDVATRSLPEVLQELRKLRQALLEAEIAMRRNGWHEINIAANEPLSDWELAAHDAYHLVYEAIR